MTERELSPFEQACKEIPEKWYEKLGIKELMFLGIGVTALLEWSKIFPQGAPIASHLVGGAIYGLSALADNAMTLELFSAQDKAVQKGIPEMYREANRFLKHTKTAKDYRASWKSISVPEGLGLVLSTIAPVMSPGIAAARLIAVASNHRKVIRYNRAVEISSSRTPPNQR